MWYNLALVMAACIVFVIGWLAFGDLNAGLYAGIVASIGALLKPPVSKNK